MDEASRLLISNVLMAIACVVLGTLSVRRDAARHWRPFWKTGFSRQRRIVYLVGCVVLLIGLFLRIPF